MEKIVIKQDIEEIVTKITSNMLVMMSKEVKKEVVDLIRSLTSGRHDMSQDLT